MSTSNPEKNDVLEEVATLLRLKEDAYEDGIPEGRQAAIDVLSMIDSFGEAPSLDDLTGALYAAFRSIMMETSPDRNSGCLHGFCRELVVRLLLTKPTGSGSSGRYS